VAVHSQVVGGTVLVVLVHLKASVPPFSLLCRADLDGGLVVMRYDRGVVFAPFLVLLLPSLLLDLVGWRQGIVDGG
jgi:hypothetical protein